MYNAVLRRDHLTTDAVETQQCILCECVCFCWATCHCQACIQILSVAQRFYGKFTSPKTIKPTKVFI
jgi:hypothetical protein